ncbi:MAG TPA: hypothetical protein EYP08_00190 [Pyrodictiaceae archaeon]|nr:hypothetical protein [Pyrodictiaceae archaeon]HIQ55362.1 hypothetical protein [Pyrodictium sp.]
MPLKQVLFTAFIIALTILIVSSAFTVSATEAFKDYMLKVSARKVKPNDEIQITVRSAKPGETLLIVITDEKGNPVNTSVTTVYKGTVAQAGHLIIVRTDFVDALAVFCIKAPSEPGLYTIKLYDPIGGVKAEEQILVELTIQQLLGRPEIVVVGLLILVAVLATIYLFVLMPA